ncbi:bola-like protein-domain-containing protein [Multifurca ochricompacta]|uniref:Bola-like protein-domain-containing protein n=1 Tax=Multifurca ochricompacta TaxID=376703 RepID=A0AAD4QNE0_9AGAM|nr:bola-like protein-domain-containing protein [Multifurca ochricompacta]
MATATIGGGSVDKQPIERAIRDKLTSLLQPSILAITNDSWQHRHHAAMRDQQGGNGETHFSVQVVSEEFVGKATMQRHRMIYAALSEELKSGLHALSLNTKTEAEHLKAQVHTPQGTC